MVCPKCGAISHDKNWRCGNCHYIFREIPQTREAPKATFQTPLQQPQQSKLTTIQSSSPEVEREHSGYTVPQEPGNGRIDWNVEAYEEPQPQPAAPNPTPQHQAEKKKKKPRNLVYVVVATLLLVVVNVVMFYKFSSNQSAKMFAEAEKAFAAQNYPTAQALYNQFLRDYPDEDLASVAQVRLSEIRINFNEMKQQKERRLSLLISNAEAAYRETRLLIPENDNVIEYTSEALRIDPTNTRALQLQALVVQYYQQKATEAKRKRRYRTAMINYEKILRIIPNDANARAELDKLKAITGKI